jgi:uncharacterized membrane protein HdeD (DUF308 family)
MENQDARQCPPISEIEGMDRDSNWSLALGFFAILLGIVALSVPGLVTLASMEFLGILLLLSGFAQIFQTLRAHHGREFFIHLPISIFYIVLGGLLITNPALGALSTTLLVALFLMAAGVFRIIGAVAARFKNWGWADVNGIVAFLLGLALWWDWPFSGLWVLGTFVAIEMIFNGWALLMFAVAARKDISHIRSQCAAQA